MKVVTILTTLPLLVVGGNVTVCEYFNATTCSGEDTNFALKNYGVCSFEACGGDEVVISSRGSRGIEASCIGDTYLRLLDTDGDLLGYNDDAEWNDKCSEIIFSLPQEHSCHVYESRVGCFGSKTDCEAQVVVNVSGQSESILSHTPLPFHLIILFFAATRPVFVEDSLSSLSGDNWVLSCFPFNVSGSQDNQASVFDYDPEVTAVCR